ncbi:MAG: hypothetical protein M3N29_08760 [Chloroflexota bacterium]|nr:hypothetical protein [Chloroflexota bacterium]
MKITPSLILLFVAIVLFAIAAIAVDLAGLNLVALGLAAFAGAFAIDRFTGRGGL